MDCGVFHPRHNLLWFAARYSVKLREGEPMKVRPNLRVNRSACTRPSNRPRQAPKGLKFDRVFSAENTSPFDQVEWEKRTAKITDDGGKVIFEQQDVEVPKSWSELATKIAVSKYFYGD